MAKWFVMAKGADFQKIGEQFHISPVVARIIRNRDVIGEEQIRKYLYGTIEELYDPKLLKGMEEAVRLLKERIEAGDRIRIIGDYDVDGICSTFILKRGLSACRATVDFSIPDRMKDGYGLNEHLVEKAAEEGIDTIVTCDNGIAAAEQIALAKEKGMFVIVTDHHEVPYEQIPKGKSEEPVKRYLLPPADAVVDPKLPGCAYPFREICGATVAFKLVQELFLAFGLPGLSGGAKRERGLLDELLELAAFATICDVMPLRDENRILVRHGLSLMQDSQNEGLRALMEVCGVGVSGKGKKLTAFHIGFVLGPCMNASGRLDTAVRALSLLECKSREEAIPHAAFLKQLNDSRKEMTERYVQQAVECIENTSLKEDRVLVVFLPDCHESIAGIIAGRIRERYYRPAFVLTRGEEGVKGSARSIEEYHIYEEMTKCSRFFTKYGGHKMAAGLSMREEDIEPFRREINRLCELTQEDLEEKIRIDVPMPVSYVSFSLVEELERLEPFGTGNSKPVFVQKDLLFLSAKALGKNGNTLRFTVMDDRNQRWEMIYFGNREGFDNYVRDEFGSRALEDLYERRGSGIRMSAIYYPEINTWQGNSRLQLVMQHYMRTGRRNET